MYAQHAKFSRGLAQTSSVERDYRVTGNAFLALKRTTTLALR